jgi:transposase
MAGRPLHVNWTHDETTLRALYKAELDPRLRSRWQALWRLRVGETAERTAELVGAHVRTVLEWVHWYRAGGTEEVRRHRVGGGRGRAALLTVEQQAALRTEVASGRFKTGAQIGAWVEARWGVRYSLNGLYGLLGRLEASPKVPRPRSTGADPAAQTEWKRRGVRSRAAPGGGARRRGDGVRR